MGYWKDWHMERQELGLSLSPDDAYKTACADCIADEGLRTFVARSGPVESCDFCGASDVHGIAVDDLFQYMAGCLAAEYDDPNNEVGWCSAEGGWVGARVIDSDDLLMELDEPLANESLRQLFWLSFDREWCQRSPYRLAPHQRLTHGWALFSEYVRYQSRHLFLRSSSRPAFDDPDYIDPSEMLDEVGKAIQNVAHRLVRELPVGAILVRARAHAVDTTLSEASELGSPPRAKTRSTRMSPAGMPVFYAAEDVDAATAEVQAPSGDVVTTASWTTTEPIPTSTLPSSTRCRASST